MKKRMLSLLLAAVMVLSLAACGSKDTGETTTYEDPYKDMTYEDASDAIYENVLGEFDSYYAQAAEAENESERFALYAIAEAKLLESAVFLPTRSQGGYYVLSRMAPYTATTVLWGSDNYRYYTALVTTELIKAEDYNYMREKWNELLGTGTYLEWAEEYLLQQGYELKDTFTYGDYDTDPVTWDLMASYLSTVAEPLANTYDSLVLYDYENVLQPALAESYEVSDDGLVYTFHIREGATWVDSQGRYIADITADDWVAGLQHLLDCQAGLEYLATTEGCGIVNAEEYAYGTLTDFDQVGIKALDDYTLEFTLESEFPSFMTMVGYAFTPLCRSYYESQGGVFGVAEYAAARSQKTYTYGSSPDNIAYCGPYLITSYTAENSIIFSANESYWNADAVRLKTITWTFDDNSDEARGYTETISGVRDSVNLTINRMQMAQNATDADGNNVFDTYAYVSLTDACTYGVYLNLYRQAYANVSDGAAASTLSESDGNKSNIAISNVHFRRAIFFAIDRASYNAVDASEDLKYNALRNSYTPGNYVILEEPVTVDINGTETTFPSGTWYGEIVQAQLDADNVPIQVWNAETESSDGYDGWYNVENAVAELELAIEELAAQGVTISAEEPIYLDLPYPANSDVYSARANAIKLSVDAALEGKVIINLVSCANFDEWDDAGYNIFSGFEANYNLYDLSGWIPDYGDPSSYLATFYTENGYNNMMLGIY